MCVRLSSTVCLTMTVIHEHDHTTMQATRAALYGSYDVPRPLDPYDIPRGSSVSHPPPPGELYDTPRTSQYDKPRTSVSVHPPKEVDPSDAKVDVSHTYDIPS